MRRPVSVVAIITIDAERSSILNAENLAAWPVFVNSSMSTLHMRQISEPQAHSQTGSDVTRDLGVHKRLGDDDAVSKSISALVVSSR